MTDVSQRVREGDASTHDDAPVTASKTAKPDRALLAEVVTINAPAQELYAFWRDTPRLAGVLENVLSIEAIDSVRSRWTVKAPAGREVSWESVITDDQPGSSISWQSAEGADVANSGRVEFKDAGQRGTIVRATIAYEPPGGTVGQFIAKLFQREPRIQARRDLHRFKQLIETGEVATGARNQRILRERSGD
ncbi:putative membrane protein [Novosphingobium hassiacum]|uniref:Putative membrane protein n=1 Tax=Novosphingobium hassiacum TaxID=173676 RepID=A0A7W5ZU36_9SPHN|nr:putative membrane protein [Novosphingobium hassiacum]